MHLIYICTNMYSGIYVRIYTEVYRIIQYSCVTFLDLMDEWPEPFCRLLRTRSNRKKIYTIRRYLSFARTSAISTHSSSLSGFLTSFRLFHSLTFLFFYKWWKNTVPEKFRKTFKQMTMKDGKKKEEGEKKSQFGYLSENRPFVGHRIRMIERERGFFFFIFIFLLTRERARYPIERIVRTN